MLPNDPPALPPAPPAPPPDAVPRWARALVLLSLVAFFLFVLSALVVLVGLVPLAGGALLAARPLYELGALDHDYSDSLLKGLVLAVGAFVLALSWRGIRFAATALFEAPPYRPKWFVTGPTLWLGYWLAFHLMVLVPVDRLGLSDIDDDRLGSAVIALVVYTGLSTAWLAMRGAWALLAATWRATQTRPILAGFVIASAGGLSGLSVAADIVMSPGDDTYDLGEPALAPSEVVETSRKALVKVAMASSPGAAVSSMASLGSGPGALGTGRGGDDGRFEECFKTLHASPPSPSEVARASRKYDETVVWDAMVDVCLHYSRGKVTGRLQPYFQKALQNANCRQHRGAWQRCEMIPVEECELHIEDDPISRLEHRLFTRRLCQLNPRDEQVLRLSYVRQYSAPEIAARLGISHAAARQRLTTARGHLHELFPEYFP